MRRSALYHGTRYADRIIREGVLRYARIGDPLISFSRNRAVAHHFASMDRDDDDRFGAVFVFDRDSLRTRYRVEPYDYSDGGSPLSSEYVRREEAEEMIWMRDVIDVQRHLIEIVRL